MRLLYLIPSLSNPGGMERILSEKINYLVEFYGYKITVMTTDQMDKDLYFNLHKDVELIHLNLNFNNYFDKPLLSKFLITKRLLKLYKNILQNYLNRNDVSVCISLGGKELEFLYKIKGKTVKICELHFGQSVREQFLVSRSNNKIFKKIGQYRTKQLIMQTQKLDKLVVLTKADEDIWKKTNTNVVQIYNFVTNTSLQFSKLNEKRVIAVGRLDAQKGFDLLVDAWELVKKKNTDWKLDIYGQGEWYNFLQEKITNKKLQSSLSLKGVSKDVVNELLTSSIFVLSSRYEGFAMVLLESLSCGLPIVSFNCKTGPSEIIENNDCGILVPAENIEQLSEGILKLIESIELREKMGSIAKKKAKNFSKESVMNQWHELIKSLI